MDTVNKQHIAVILSTSPLHPSAPREAVNRLQVVPGHSNELCEDKQTKI